MSVGDVKIPRRDFEAPDYLEHPYKTEEEIHARIDELKEMRARMDPEKQFFGLKRLGSSYSIVEPYAFFDGPTEHQRVFNRVVIWGGAFLVCHAAGVLWAKSLTKATWTTGIIRGMMAWPFVGFGAESVGKYITDRRKKKQEIYFHYALMHEDQFPRIERKKYGEILDDWPAKRSLNKLAKSWPW